MYACLRAVKEKLWLSRKRTQLVMPRKLPCVSAMEEDKNFYDLFLAADDEIVMDSMAFGMGCCCLQVTFQARDMDESRRVFDLLTPLAPISDVEGVKPISAAHCPKSLTFDPSSLGSDGAHRRRTNF